MTDEVLQFIMNVTSIAFERWTFFIFVPQYMRVKWLLMRQLPMCGGVTRYLAALYSSGSSSS